MTTAALNVTKKTALTGLMFAVFALYGSSTVAQSPTTYTYNGNAFTSEFCTDFVTILGYQCVAGNVTASATFRNLPAGFTGILNGFPGPWQPTNCSPGSVPCLMSFSIAAPTMTITSATPNVCLGFRTFQFINGAMVQWEFGANTWSTAPPGNPCFASGRLAFATTQGSSSGGCTVFLGGPSAVVDSFTNLTISPVAGGNTCSSGTWILGSAPPALTKAAGDNQTGNVSIALPNVNAQLPNPLVVKTTDSQGNPVAGVQISFAITAQPQGAVSASLSAASVTTATDGTASTQLNLGTVAGPYQATASCSSCTPSSVTFTENASCQVLYSGEDPFRTNTAGNDTIMLATFTPGGPKTPIGLKGAADACGFKGFNWQQMITVDPGGGLVVPEDPLPLIETGNVVYLGSPVSPTDGLCLSPTSWDQNGIALCSLIAPPAFFDPPLGGYAPPPNNPNLGTFNPWPFFYPAFPLDGTAKEKECTILRTPCAPLPFVENKEGTVLSFADDPHQKNLSGEAPSPHPTRNHLAFETKLVGVDNQGGIHTLRSWRWNTTFNGHFGGIDEIDQTSSIDLIDPNSGTGGVTITSIDGVPQTPPSVTCAATPKTLWPPNGKSVAVTVSGTIVPGTQAIPPSGTVFAVTDQYGQVQPSGAVFLDTEGNYSFDVPLIADRNGNDLNGRTYTINVTATDQIGNVGSCSTVVTVPHDQGN